MSRHLVNALDTVAQHTPGRLVAMPKPGPSFSDHGWRTIAMCGSQQMIATKYEQVCEIKDGIVVSTRWDHEANARRLVACWNACIAIPTDRLESDYAQGYEPLGHVEHLKAQRDELLAALERAERKLSAYVGVCTGDKELTDAVLPMARATIAKVKGGAA